MADPQRGRSAWSTAELALRLVLALAFSMFVLQTVLPPGRDAKALAWLACGMLAGVRRKPSVRQRVTALAVLTGVWTIAFMTLFVLSDPRAAELSGIRLAMLGLATVAGGLLGSAAAFVGFIISSGWPSRALAPSAPPSASALHVVFDRRSQDDDDEGRAGVVEAAGDDVDASWIGRRVLVLNAAPGDRASVTVDGVIALDSGRDA
jgi:hypothetical protein